MKVYPSLFTPLAAAAGRAEGPRQVRRGRVRPAGRGAGPLPRHVGRDVLQRRPGLGVHGGGGRPRRPGRARRQPVAVHVPRATGRHYRAVRGGALLQARRAGEGDRVLGWLAVDSEPDRFGQTTVLQFPQALPTGQPLISLDTFTSNVGRDPVLSQAITQRATSVLRGDTLVVPIGRGLLYVQPLYLDTPGEPVPVALAGGRRHRRQRGLRSGDLPAVPAGAPGRPRRRQQRHRRPARHGRGTRAARSHGVRGLPGVDGRRQRSPRRRRTWRGWPMR